jgi:ParB-like chromosome segregation protein Spo0J
MPVETDVQDGIRAALTPLTVPITELTPYPGNPRRGHVTALAQGLQEYGQYKPLVVQESTGRVLVGNQTFLAAQRLGWTDIAAVRVDVDDVTARKILAVDNRTNELGSYDGRMLLDLLESLRNSGGVEGTGYSEDDVDHLTDDLARLEEKAKTDAGSPGGPAANLGDPQGVEGPEGGDAPIDAAGGVYRVAIECGTREQEDELLERYLAQGYPVTPIFARSRDRSAARVPVKLKPTAFAPEEPLEDAEVNKIAPALAPLVTSMDQLTPFPGNPRRGDVAAIARSLAKFGQYRPIVARRNGLGGQILAGNHTYHAADELGWTSIAVAFIECDDDEAARLVAWDNRASDLGRNDEAALADFLTELPDLAGTGYGRAELDDILERVAHDTPRVYGVVVDCADEDDQVALLAELEGSPYTVRALLS